ncbi:MAG: DUF2461 domain-containing protein [Oscillospiraceae bacterium]|nr:DUF2461 domain-containing protein [Oscillospiraceae bacterium]
MSFSEESVKFLFENRVVDSKAWFLEHRADYDRLVLDPMRELVNALEPTMLSIDPQLICEPKVGRSISRIYRDTRFSNDKSIFRDVMWCVFIRDKKLYNGLPAFWFEFSPRIFRYGCGYYHASAESMEAMRAMIIADDKSFKAAQKALNKQTVFRLDGEKYKRSRHSEQTAEKREWLDRRDIGFITESEDFDLLFSDALADKLAADFKLLVPMYDFMMAAEARVLKA